MTKRKIEDTNEDTKKENKQAISGISIKKRRLLGEDKSEDEDEEFESNSSEESEEDFDQNDCIDEELDSRFHAAIVEDNRESIEFLIDQYPNLLTHSFKESNVNDRYLAIHLAAFYDRLSILESIIKKGANPKATTENGNSILHIAATGGHLEIVNYILKNNLVNVNCNSLDNQTPIHDSAYNGELKLFKFLLDNGANPNVFNDEGDNALHIAAAEGHLEIIEYILEHNLLDVDHKNFKYGWTPLHNAVSNGQLKAVELLLAKGADPKYTVKNGNSILHLAATEGDLEIIEYILEHNLLDVDHKNFKNGWTPLHNAASNGQLKTVILLLKSGANSIVLDKENSSVIKLAAENGHLKIVKLLLASGVCINPSRSYGSDIDNAINISKDIRKIANNELIDNFKGNYTDKKSLDFAAQCFIEIHKKGKISYNDYNDIFDKIKNNVLLNSSEYSDLKQVLNDYLIKYTENTIHFLGIIEDEIIDKNRLFPGKVSQLKQSLAKKTGIVVDDLIKSLIEIFNVEDIGYFNAKDNKLYYLAKEIVKTDFYIKLMGTDNIPLRHAAMNNLKKNIIDIQDYLLPTSKLGSAYEKLLQSYNEMFNRLSIDNNWSQSLWSEIKLDEQALEIEELKRENKAKEEQLNLLSNKVSKMEEFLKTLGFPDDSNAQTSDNSQNNTMQVDETTLTGDGISRMDEVD